MYDFRKFYINGEWVDPVAANDCDVFNPTTEKPIGSISLGAAVVAQFVRETVNRHHCGPCIPAVLIRLQLRDDGVG
jgi:hypothetical protein